MIPNLFNAQSSDAVLLTLTLPGGETSTAALSPAAFDFLAIMLLRMAAENDDEPAPAATLAKLLDTMATEQSML